MTEAEQVTDLVHRLGQHPMTEEPGGEILPGIGRPEPVKGDDGATTLPVGLPEDEVEPRGEKVLPDDGEQTLPFREKFPHTAKRGRDAVLPPFGVEFRGVQDKASSVLHLTGENLPDVPQQVLGNYRFHLRGLHKFEFHNRPPFAPVYRPAGEKKGPPMLIPLTSVVKFDLFLFNRLLELGDIPG